jgi:cytochrome c oxidase cbb3-type subunit 3
LFQDNCAFCHAADGTGRNWIGSFLDEHPRDLTGARARTMSDDELRNVIREGVAGTSMPAWRHVLSEAQVFDIAAYVRRVQQHDQGPQSGTATVLPR